jgi:hypothetical protein
MKYTLKLATLFVSSLALGTSLHAGPPTAADVGDVESFGHAALYMGAASGDFSLASPCASTAVNCTELNPAGTRTDFQSLDNLRIKLPKKATRTIIYPALNFFVNYQLQNHSTTDFEPQGQFQFRVTVDVESDALLDPSILDPNNPDPVTGDPMPAAGKLRALFSYNYNDDRSMQPRDRQHQQFTLVRVGNAGINKAALVNMGIPQATVDAMFAGAMTVRMNVKGTSKLCDFASVTTNMRLFGD